MVLVRRSEMFLAATRSTGTGNSAVSALLMVVSTRVHPRHSRKASLSGIVAAGLWFLFFRSIQSIASIGMSAAILGLINIAFVAVIRGSAVRLGPEQFPELHSRVEHLAHRMGLRRTPDVYLMQGNGTLNAFAT